MYGSLFNRLSEFQEAELDIRAERYPKKRESALRSSAKPLDKRSGDSERIFYRKVGIDMKKEGKSVIRYFGRVTKD